MIITKDEWSIRLIGNNPAIDGYAEWDRKITGLSRDVAFLLAEKGMDIILDEGFWERKTRDEMRKRIEAIGAHCVLYYLDTPLETMRERVLRRNRNLTKESFEISIAMLESYLHLWEPPTKDEEFILAR